MANNAGVAFSILFSILQCFSTKKQSYQTKSGIKFVKLLLNVYILVCKTILVHL